MYTFKQALAVVFLLFPAVALSPAPAQNQFSNLKSEWRAQRYKEVLRPLLEYRDSLGDGTNFEVDYMIGTAMCHLPDFTQDGIGYLQALPAAYGNNLSFDGRRVVIARTINDECGCAGIDSKSDNAGGCAGVDSKSDDAGKNRPNAGAIRDNVKRRLQVPLVFEYNFDRPGQDYRSFGVGSPNVCRQACIRDSNCKAFTYVKPSSAGESGVCWLKGSVPGRNPSTCCISGVK